MALYFNMMKEKQKKIPILAVCLGMSFLIHVGVTLQKWGSSFELENPDKRQNEPIEIAELPKQYRQRQQNKNPSKLSREQQMAETEDAHNRELDPHAKFLSQYNQKALNETKAKRVDDFRSRKGSGAKGILRPEEGTQAPTGDEIASHESGGQNFEESKTGEKNKKLGIKRNWKTLSLHDLGVNGDGQSEAATDDALRGVKEGEGTVLSTREFRYYSYYHRIKELLRQYWKPNVERQIARIWNKGRNINSDELTTRVLVLLNEKGAIQKISKLSSSGFFELDEAAVEAFQKAGPFPNPPQGMVDADGFVRIRWDFILQTDAGPAIQWRSYGAMPN